MVGEGEGSDAVRGGSAKCVLVVNPEITSAHLEWRDRDCHFIFGDVCTAVIVEKAESVTRALVAEGHYPTELRPIETSLEDAFFHFCSARVDPTGDAA